MRYPWGLGTATCETLRSSLRDAAAVEEAESVARGVEEVPDVVERPLLGAEDEDGAALRLLRQPRRVPQWQLRRIQRPQDLPVQRQHHRPVPRQILRRRPDQPAATAALRHPSAAVVTSPHHPLETRGFWVGNWKPSGIWGCRRKKTKSRSEEPLGLYLRGE
jgi:hypothetical protein